MSPIQAIKKAVQNPLNYYLINAYFYNDHDLRLMLKWSEQKNAIWEHLLILYKTNKNEYNTVIVDTYPNSQNFSIPYPEDSTRIYPIKAIMAPHPGYGKEVDVKNVMEFYSTIGTKQIFW